MSSAVDLAAKVRRAVMASMAFTEKNHPGFTHDDYDAAHAALAELEAAAAERDALIELVRVKQAELVDVYRRAHAAEAGGEADG